MSHIQMLQSIAAANWSTLSMLMLHQCLLCNIRSYVKMVAPTPCKSEKIYAHCLPLHAQYIFYPNYDKTSFSIFVCSTEPHLPTRPLKNHEKSAPLYSRLPFCSDYHHWHVLKNSSPPPHSPDMEIHQSLPPS